MDDIELKRDQVDVKRERAGYDDFSTIGKYGK